MARSVQVGGHLAWLDATYDQYLALGAGNVLVDVAGHRLNNTPAWSGRLWIDWTRSDRWSEFVVASRGCHGENDGVLHALQRQRSAAIVRSGSLDLSAEFGPTHRRWFVAAFARNLTNEDYITGAVGTPPPAIGGRPGDRRQLGVQLGIGR